MNRPWQIWTVFGVSLALVLAAMAWVSRVTLQLDRSERDARQRALLEENIRLALWRMDAALSPLIAAENGRPYFEYRSFYTPERAYTKMFNQLLPDEILVPSPLLTQRPPYVRLHFQVTPDDELHSPQVPTGNMRDLAESAYATGDTLRESARRLQDLGTLLDVPELRERMTRVESSLLAGAEILRPERRIVRRDDRAQGLLAQNQMEQMQRRSQQERSARAKQIYDNTLNQVQVAQQTSANLYDETLEPHPAAQPPDATADPSGGALRPFWLGDALVLARRVVTNGQDYIQGCWLDWPEIERKLIEEIGDLLPAARLEPVRSPAPSNGTRMLATIPVRLIPGDVPGAVVEPMSLARLSLTIAWVGAVAAAIAIGALLRGTVSLSERRAAFVSAVTHELRTPLTSLGMYAEMMRKGMIPSEEKRQRYLDTMSAEVHRLRHLVNNVLTFGRMERGVKEQDRQIVTLNELIDRIGARLAERTEQADIRLAVDADDKVRDREVNVDSATIEQILFNLVDNACKYAGSAGQRLVHWEVSLAEDAIHMRIRDHGLGIPQRDAKRIFKAFRKSATEAAHTAPGVGLGLCLSRRLARAMGGDLQLETYAPDGASFLLSLPLE